MDESDQKHSLHLSRSYKDENVIIEDRFIPSRRLIQDFHLSENISPKKETSHEQDPQTFNVADLYSE